MQGRCRRSGHDGLTTFYATNFFYYSLPFKVIVAQPPYDSTSALHGRTRAVFDGGLGVEPPAKISDPPAAIKKAQGGSTFYVPMH